MTLRANPLKPVQGNWVLQPKYTSEDQVVYTLDQMMVITRFLGQQPMLQLARMDRYPLNEKQEQAVLKDFGINSEEYYREPFDKTVGYIRHAQKEEKNAEGRH